MAGRLTSGFPSARPRRFLRTMLLCALVLGAAIAVPRSRTVEAETTVIDWRVDESTRTITVTVNIAVWASSPPANGRQEQVVEEAIDRIRAGIMDAWDGQKFKCYVLRVELNLRRVTGPAEVRDNEVPVELNAAVYPVDGPSGKLGSPRSHVAAKGYDPDEHLTDEHQYDPDTGPSGDASDWALGASAQEYAHEFGHILGLTDTYIEGKGTLQPGAVRDLMTTLSKPVDARTVVKAVRRSGKVDESLIKCPLRIDMARAYAGLPGFLAIQLEVHGCAPDYTPPSTDPIQEGFAEFHGTVSVGGDYLSAFPVLGGATDSGEIRFVTKWWQDEPEVVISLPENAIAQQVVTTGGGPLARPTGAQLRNGGGDLRLSETLTIVPFEGPCT